ncbi:ribosome-associated protein [Serinibacter salmoneus]|uniref:Ribosome-associated protein n=1 Tax=Serinibacter salmoneus TaxID=556530 RepID=A0A2A9D2D4_9MICO|nr:ribosome-associated protein [Serinibacter salmoneus]
MAAGPGIPDGLRIPAAELTEQFSRSPGPGGQSVNTTDSRVQLRFDLGTTASLTEAQRSRALERLAPRLVGTELVIEASEHRSQWRNRAAARQRLAELLRESLIPQPQRRATKPTRGSQRRRLAAKTQRSQLKQTRRRPGPE